jgi:Fe-S-cluster-containing hydrogenase component 2
MYAPLYVRLKGHNIMSPQPRLVTNSQLCRDCQACTLACSLHHEGECNLSLARLRVLKDMARYVFQIVVCCYTASADRPGCVEVEDPLQRAACMAACPNEALRLNQEGFPVIYRDECLLCGACAVACPYQAIFYDARTDRYVKCDRCEGRDEGPLCAQVCPVGAIAVEEV